MFDGKLARRDLLRAGGAGVVGLVCWSTDFRGVRFRSETVAAFRVIMPVKD
jgi:hypothetical protein